MKTITDDPEGFFDNGGWTFLDPESDPEDPVEDEEEEEEDYEVLNYCFSSCNQLLPYLRVLKIFKLFENSFFVLTNLIY